MEPVYTPVIAVAKALFRAMGWRLDVRGAHHIPAEGGAVIASNHVGYLDFIVVGWGAVRRGRLVRFMAKQEIFDHPVGGPLMRGMHHIPVDRLAGGRAGVAAAAAALRRGELVGMFPEGTISRSFVPAAARSGAARLALVAGVPLIPAAVWGTQRIWTKGRPRNFQRDVALALEFGPPLRPGTGDDPTAVTDRLMARISQMVDRNADEYPQRPGGAHDTWWVPAHRGGTAPTVAQARAWALGEIAAKREARRATRRST